MALRVLQANINHCESAQDLLYQSMAQWLIHLAVVSEPYYVPPDWVSDRDGTVALVSRGAVGSPPFEKVTKGRGCVAALLGGIVIIGCYFSPNRNVADFEHFLAELGSLVLQSRPYPVIVAGDLNGKSEAWGSPVRNERAEPMEDWLVQVGLSVLNRGSEWTCVRHNGGSIVDVTFASPALESRVQGWRVIVNVETLSDHRYIRYDVSATLDTTRWTNICGAGPRWVLHRLDREALEEAAIVHAWASSPESLPHVDDEANWFRETLSQICDAAMPRARPIPPKKEMYWWSSEIADLRRACMSARRQYTRHRRRTRRSNDVPPDAEEIALLTAYKAAKKAIKIAIRRSKEAARNEMLEALDVDPWGRPYRAARKKLRPWAPPLTQSLRPQLVDQVTSALFPSRPPHAPPSMAAVLEPAEDNHVPPVTEAELRVALHRLRTRKAAPGLDGIPGRVVYLALREHLGPRFLRFLSQCLEQGSFPLQWRTGKLVLLQKEGRPADSPSAYRPIVLLDEVGKLFERIIADRITEHLESEGPNLSENQFGFRRGRSTVHAILRVKTLADEAVRDGDVMIAVSLDISNAFNTLPWPCIKEAFGYHRMPKYLIEIVDSYLSERFITYPGREAWGRKAMSCGVPQGSVLGPLLWNIGYDWVLRGATLRGIETTCYADDTLITARGITFRDAAILATAGVAQMVRRIRMLGLEVALHKSEALCFHGARNAPPPGSGIVVGGERIAVQSTMKYLGLVLDSRWNFAAHFERLAIKLVATCAALSRLLPNLGGPRTSCRRLYMGIVRSMAMYGAPVWADNLSRSNITHLRRAQRVMASRVIRAYCTISAEAACLIAGSLPWDLDAGVLSSLYHWREEARRTDMRPAPREIGAARDGYVDDAIELWTRRLDESAYGRRTIDAILPALRQWLDREHGSCTFRVSQMLSGHGCFGKYLCRIGREETQACHHCGAAVDSAEHTLAECPAWADERSALCAVIGQDLTLPAVIAAIVSSRPAWRAFSTFCETVMSQKEDAEREREQEDPARRRARRGRRPRGGRR
ncbi:hypothetical protein JYU34_022602 [Plutella xylostella]|uniref:Reverse transcriptase domain-containing protein n=1 Tax=Plutella xylostella TaxID=51655 RepID=A0ABQ7PPT0_PLUXY|nr:hypothetical protein JYU34_022602 [Plutella xylostella]